MGSQLLQSTEINIVLHWKFWRKYGSVSHLFSCNRGSYTQIFYCSSIVTNISTKNVFQLLQKQNQTHNFLNFQFWIPNIPKICMNLVRLLLSFLSKEKLLTLIWDSKLGICESMWLSLSQATKMTLTLLILSTLKFLINMLA